MESRLSKALQQTRKNVLSAVTTSSGKNLKRRTVLGAEATTGGDTE